MTTTHSTTASPAARGWRLMGAALAVLSLILFASGAATAQDTDDDGVLPFHDGSSSTGGSVGSGGSSSSSTSGASVGTTISIAGPLQDGLLDTRRPHVQLSTAAGGTDVAVGEDLEDATFTGEAEGLNVVAQDDAVRVQGPGTLTLPPGMAAAFYAAQNALARNVLLVLDDGTASLEDVLAGKTQPELVISLGDLLVVDLVVFQNMLAKHAEDLPGMHATLVFGSVDTALELHLSAVRGSTDGDPLEVLIQ
ncbi:MAG: hypothetical protein ACYTG2_03820 [Planctomycetota bacterium]